MKNIFDEIEESLSFYRITYRNYPRKALIHIAFRCFRLFFIKQAIALPQKPLDCWMTIKDYQGIDITGNIIKDPKSLIIPKIPNKSHIYFNLQKALKENPQIKRFGLVFFMGIGDYFFMTSFLNYFKQSFPEIKFDAYVSTSKDTNNSPLLLSCIKKNPLFDKIYTFKGSEDKDVWKNYDYSECYRKISKDTLLLPMIYECNHRVSSRIDSLIETFNLNPLPYVPDIFVPLDRSLSQQSKNMINDITEKLHKYNLKGVIFLQICHRSSNYAYPYAKELVKRLIDDKFLIITPDEINFKHENLISLYGKKIVIYDSIMILSKLKEQCNVIVLGVVSCFMAIASGLKIPALLMQHFIDPSLKSYLPKDVYIIVNSAYADLPEKNCFVATNKDYIEKKPFYNYSVDFVMKSFEQLQKMK